MRRFRFTFLAVCLVLVYLGWADVSVYLRNQQPQSIPIEELQRHGAPREWLHITGGYHDLVRAISTSGTIDLDALLVPLKSSPEATFFDILVETRHPRLLELYGTYHLRTDSVFAQERFLEEHRDEMLGRRDVTGTVITGLVASGNRDKMMTLAKAIGMDISEDVLFISEGNEPAKLRGFFFLGIGLVGLIKSFFFWKRPGSAQTER
jgi:hypothetical protein